MKIVPLDPLDPKLNDFDLRTYLLIIPRKITALSSQAKVSGPPARLASAVAAWRRAVSET